ncbi:secreted RxLR effector protein 161-like [Apium graveolens]|uniref:secreted RxLR effector protein 161-like n=1 Tax=Apium graveolens TaxID=4045 RepID=UPI003D7AA238
MIVGNLVYLTVTLPDITYTVHIVSQFITFPTIVYWATVLRILKYLCGIQFSSPLFHPNSSLELCANSDVDWAGDPEDRKSKTGFCIFLDDSLISWKSKKQDIFSRLSSKAKYRAMASTTCEVVWLRPLLEDLGVSLLSCTPLYCDNESAIYIARNSVFQERTKHIENDCNLAHHHLLQRTIFLPFVPSSLQIANIFTKAYSILQFRFLSDKLSILIPATW